MLRRNGLACILLLVLGLFYAVSPSSAAVLELKTGQKVEGDYVGGSTTEIKLKVGNQVLVFPVQDISRLHFVPPASEGDFSSDSLKTLKILKGLQSVTKAGVTLREYSNRVLDATVEVDAFLNRYKSSGDPLIREEVHQAMALYNAASQGWSDAIRYRTWDIVEEVRVPDELMQTCPRLHDPKALQDPKPDKPHTWYYSLSAVWSCADERLTKIEELMKAK